MHAYLFITIQVQSFQEPTSLRVRNKKASDQQYASDALLRFFINERIYIKANTIPTKIISPTQRL